MFSEIDVKPPFHGHTSLFSILSTSLRENSNKFDPHAHKLPSIPSMVEPNISTIVKSLEGCKIKFPDPDSHAASSFIELKLKGVIAIETIVEDNHTITI